MQPTIEPHIQTAVDIVAGLLDAYELQVIDFEALSAVDILDYLKDFDIARPHLDLVKHRRLVALQRALLSHLNKK